MNFYKLLKLASIGKYGLVMVELWDVKKTLKLLSDVCNRARCAELFLSVSSCYYWYMLLAYLWLIDC
jgi:hypothetical protein